MEINRLKLVVYILGSLLIYGASSAQADFPEFQIEIKNNRFIPEQLKIPAGTKVRLRVINCDKTPEEFESYDFNREKIILGGKEAKILVGPLPEGEYKFFGEFNPGTAQGVLIVE
ncbi:MAG: cupredoxin domain-containing protein [Candidatus Dadabacteria bacterium]|nr:MAG: cupredoxin domain-containing protein [Candidatus Dadabacteria bacterium]